MQKIIRVNWLLMIGVIGFIAFGGRQVAYAQIDDPSISIAFTGKKAITRVEKLYHKPKPKPPRSRPHAKPKPVVIQAPLLALRWGLKMKDSKGMPKPVHPDHVFQLEDRVQLMVEVNQSGYLYIVQEDDLSMIFHQHKQ